MMNSTNLIVLNTQNNVIVIVSLVFGLIAAQEFRNVNFNFK